MWGFRNSDVLVRECRNETKFSTLFVLCCFSGILKFDHHLADKAGMGSLRRIVVCSRHSVLIAGFRALIATPAGLDVVECSEVARLRDLLAQPSAATDPVLIDVTSIDNLNALSELESRATSNGVILWVDW